ncbi:MAG: hypothetical protein AAF710_10985, partial [Planctomycetota bacterium]
MPEQKDPKINRGDDGKRGDKPEKGEKSRGNGKQGPGKSPGFKSPGAFVWIMVAVVGVALLLMVNSAQNSATKVSWQEFFTHASNGDFDPESPVVIKNDRMIGTFKEGLSGEAASGATNGRVYTPVSPENRILLTDQLMEAGQDWIEEPGSSLLLQILIAWGPIILIAFLIYFFVFRSI